MSHWSQMLLFRSQSAEVLAHTIETAREQLAKFADLSYKISTVDHISDRLAGEVSLILP